MKKHLCAALLIASSCWYSTVQAQAQSPVKQVDSALYPYAPPTPQANLDSGITTACDSVSSDDGRYVVFNSSASNLVAGDTNDVSDVFLRDTVANTTQRISVNADGSESTASSSNGCISADGRYIVYSSNGNPTNDSEHDEEDIYLYDRQNNNYRSISQPRQPCTSPCTGWAKAATIAGDGRSILFVARSVFLTAEAAPSTELYRYDMANGTVELITKNSDGTPRGLSGFFGTFSVSDDGRYIAFNSRGAFVAADTNNQNDVYLYDRTVDSISRISVDENGDQAATSYLDRFTSIKVAGDGDYVMFVSERAALVAADTNNRGDIYVYNIQTNGLELASVSNTGALGFDSDRFTASSISDDGRRVSFRSTNGLFAGITGDIDSSQFVRDLNAQTTTRIAPDLSQPNQSWQGKLSADGNSLIYSATGAELASDSNGNTDVFRVQLDTLAKTQISLGNTGVAVDPVANGRTEPGVITRAISDDGRYVLFHSEASNLDPQHTPVRGEPHLYVADRQTGENIMVDTQQERPLGFDAAGSYDVTRASLSADGRYVVYAARRSDFFDPSDGSRAIQDIFLWDKNDRSHRLLSKNAFGTVADASSYAPAISADGQHVVFVSHATNLTSTVLNATQNIYHVDLNADTISLISKDSSGLTGAADSFYPSVSGDGRYVVFASSASNLVPDDTNNRPDIFLHDRDSAQTSRVSIATDGTEANDSSFYPHISDDGSAILFVTRASNLDEALPPGGIFSSSYYYVHTPATNTTEMVNKNSNGSVIRGSGLTDGGYAGLSADGRYVLFTSGSENLVQAGDSLDTNTFPDAFVRDRQTGKTRRVGVDTAGVESADGSNGIGISADGRYVGVHAIGHQWDIASGYRAYTDRGTSPIRFVMELDGDFGVSGTPLDPSNVSPTATSLSGATAGAAHTLDIHVVGDSSQPADGVISIQASNGESCHSDDVLNANASGGSSLTNTAEFACQMTFAQAGTYELQVTYALSATHESSTTTVSITVRNIPEIFASGFEATP